MISNKTFEGVADERDRLRAELAEALQVCANAATELEKRFDRIKALEADNATLKARIVELEAALVLVREVNESLDARAEKAEADSKHAEAALAQIERRAKNAINVQNPTSMDNFIKEIGAMARAALKSCASAKQDNPSQAGREG